MAAWRVRSWRKGSLVRGDGLLDDVEGLEDGLVDEPANRVVGTLAEDVEVFADDLQGKGEGRYGVVVVEVQAAHQRLGLLTFAAQAGLLIVEEPAADALFVVHVQQLSLALLDLLQNTLTAIDLLLGEGNAVAQVFRDRLADSLASVVAEANGGVMLLDGRFAQVDGLVALLAPSALVLRADKVLVDAAIAVVAGVDELAAAGAAADRALEVAQVLAITLAGKPVRGEHGLNFVEEPLADELLVPSLVDVALVEDIAGVVGVAEQFVDPCRCSTAVHHDVELAAGADLVPPTGA
ncbi:MAG TPA: hypothetical protein VMU32_06535 [Solirubrobacteraceae bacterium]|nr:hypothetical protein [Solirubrobacteraceae bacterium]